VVALDLRAHEAVVEHSGGRAERIPLTPTGPSGRDRQVLRGAQRRGPVEIDPAAGGRLTVPLDEDDSMHAMTRPGQ